MEGGREWVEGVKLEVVEVAGEDQKGEKVGGGSCWYIGVVIDGSPMYCCCCCCWLAAAY